MICLDSQLIFFMDSSFPEPVAPPPQRILLVDDNPVNLKVLYKALEAEGYELLIAMTGEEALKLAADASPAVILLDINMPGLNGFETCRRLKAEERTSAIPVIFLSARDSLADKMNGLQSGGVDYISKPFQFEEVVLRVRIQLDLIEARQKAERESARARRLLLNILPESVAQRLQSGEQNPVDYFDDATLIFCDLTGFTSHARSRPAYEVVKELNRVFTQIDTLVERFGLEKIKTIGDAYMIAGGIPNPLPDHLERAMDFAAALLREWPQIHQKLGLRIGVHRGPVVAGIIGEKKFAYDVWGDTVNFAARLEETCPVNCCHLSRQVYESLPKDRYQMRPFGPVEMKGLGSVATFILDLP